MTYQAIVFEIVQSNLGTTSGNVEILTVNRSTAENLTSTYRCLLFTLFGTDLKRQKGTAKQSHNHQPPGMQSAFTFFPFLEKRKVPGPDSPGPNTTYLPTFRLAWTVTAC